MNIKASYCANCGSKVSKNQNFCKNCGHKIVFSASLDNSAAISSENSTISSEDIVQNLIVSQPPKMKETRPLASGVMLTLSGLSALCVIYNLTELDMAMTYTVLMLGFGIMGFLLLRKNIKSFGWGIGATIFAGISVEFLMFNLIIGFVVGLILTAIFILLCLFANRKKTT